MKRVRSVHVGVAVALAAAFALGAILPAAFGNGEDEPTAIRSALAQTGKVQGAPQRDLVLSKVVVEPGAKLALHRHRGTQVARIVSGVLTYTVERGSVVVRRGESDQNPRKVRVIKAGQTARIRPGEWVVEQPSAIHRAANRGGDRVVIFLATLLEAGAPPTTPVALP
jgi:quercetin dioxygenase-like cupin family protein